MNNKYIKLHNGKRWNLRDREETIEELFADGEYTRQSRDAQSACWKPSWKLGRKKRTPNRTGNEKL